MGEPSLSDESGSLKPLPLHERIRLQPPKVPARLTVIRTIQFGGMSRQTTAQELHSQREVISAIQPYGPRFDIEVGEQWQFLDLGWFRGDNKLDEVGDVTITNQEGKFTQTIPTPQEKQEALGKVLELGIRGNDGIYGDVDIVPFALIPASQDGFTLQHHHTIFSDPGEVMIRCHKGTARYTVCVYPK